MEDQSTTKSRSANPDHFFLEGRSGAGIYMEFVPQDIIGQNRANNDTPKTVDWQWHGSNNMLPQTLLKLVWDNELKPELLMTTSSFLVGRGVRTFREEIVDGKKSLKIEDFPAISNWKGTAKKTRKFLRKYMRKAALNLTFFNNVYTEFIVNEARNGIESISRLDCPLVRKGKPDKNGKINHVFVCGDWSKPKYDPKDPQNSNVIQLPLYDIDNLPENPFEHEKFVIHTFVETPGNPIYGIPAWYGTRNWTHLANKIPVWHSNGLDNGYNVRWHIKIPESYFDKYKTEKEKQKAKEDLRDSLDNFLAGLDNVGKGIISFFNTDQMGKDFGKWELEPLKTELNDEAFSKLWEQTSQAGSAGHGIDPSLAGIQIQGKLSSGSEKRNSYEIFMSLKTVIPREVLIEPIELLAELNQWPVDAEWWFEDIELTTLDRNPTATQTVTS